MVLNSGYHWKRARSMVQRLKHPSQAQGRVHTAHLGPGEASAWKARNWWTIHTLWMWQWPALTFSKLYFRLIISPTWKANNIQRKREVLYNLGSHDLTLKQSSLLYDLSTDNNNNSVAWKRGFTPYNLKSTPRTPWIKFTLFNVNVWYPINLFNYN